MTTAIDSATVQTLTATVKTLVVGSRQITSSVAKQLDTVRLDAIKPFGRVRVRQDDGPWTCVIGERIGGGDLVLSGTARWVDPVATITLPYVENPMVVCPYLVRDDSHLLLGFGGGDSFRIELSAPAVRAGDLLSPDGFIWAHERYNYCGAPRWRANGHSDFIAAQIEANRSELNRQDQLIKEAESLPLIVLAGLR